MVQSWNVMICQFLNLSVSYFERKSSLLFESISVLWKLPLRTKIDTPVKSCRCLILIICLMLRRILSAGILEILSYVVCTLVMDRVGRRLLLAITLSGAGLSLIASTIVNEYAENNGGEDMEEWFKEVKYVPETPPQGWQCKTEPMSLLDDIDMWTVVFSLPQRLIGITVEK